MNFITNINTCVKIISTHKNFNEANIPTYSLPIKI